MDPSCGRVPIVVRDVLARLKNACTVEGVRRGNGFEEDGRIDK